VSRKQWLLAFRILVTLLAVAYVIWKMTAKWDDFLAMFARPWTAMQWTLLVFSTLLMPLNYALESQKWRLMVRPFYPDLRLVPATIAVFAGMAAGIFTPNRIGEYAGRILFLREGKRIEAIIATFVDRICQLFVTLVGGLLALGALFLLADRALPAKILRDPISQGIFIFLSIVLGTLALLLMLAPKRFAGMIPSKWNKATWVRKTRFALQNLEFSRVVQVLGIAVLRYFVFSSQYVLLMYAFQYEGNWAEAYAMVALIFLGKSVLPVMGVFELGVRESVALLVMTAFGVAATTALGSTLMLYLVNILLPTLLGVVAMQRIKVYA
jgi:uncharacterized membrane protein YbhN (UPF0104 family)